MASQLEQLLTCCICLDRFRNPKLLPCQHSVCMEPCMEGLVDYVRRQVKCPECRAEHRIPYNGVQGYPTNVTLQRFLEAHLDITGELPDPHTGQIMERCGVCNEKNYLTICCHCDRKICDDCKSAHNDILKREIGRICNQVKRALNRLKDQQNVLARHWNTTRNGSESVLEEIDNINKRLCKAVRDRCNYLKGEAEKYYTMEQKNLQRLKDGLEQEIANAESNIDLAEKHMDDQTEWDDCELMDAKDIFLRTMDFIRSFDYDTGDFNRKARLQVPDDINKLVSQLSTLGEFHTPQKPQLDPYSSTSSLPAGLMKSKSDHRLAAQFRDQDEYSTGRTSPNMRRKFGERPVITEATDDPTSEIGGRRRFRSRFIRRGAEDEDDRLSRPAVEEEAPKPRPKAIDTEDVSRGPLSGISRMSDSPRVIQRLQEKEKGPRKPKEEPKQSAPVVSKTPVYTPPQRKASRQQSNEDEIDKIKKQNKSETSVPSTTTTATTRPSYDRVNSIRESDRPRTERTTPSPRSSTHSPTTQDDAPTRTDYSYTSPHVRKTSTDVTSSATRAQTFSRSSSTSSVGESSRRRLSKPESQRPDLSKSNSSDSNKSTESPATRKTSTSSYQREEPKTTASKTSSGSSRFQSRFLGRASTPAGPTQESDNDEGEDTTEDDTETDDSEESSEEEEAPKPIYSRSTVGAARTRDTTTGGKANDSGYGSKYGSDNSTNSISGRHGAKEPTRQDSSETKYSYSGGSGSSRAKFDELRERRQRLARSRSSAGVEDEDDSASQRPRSKDESSSSKQENGNDSSQLSNWAKYLKNKYGNKTGTSSGSGGASSASGSSIARSRSSHLLGFAKESDQSEDDSKNVDATPTIPQAGTAAPTGFANIHRSQSLQKQRTLLKIGSRGSEQGNFTWPRGIAVGPNNTIVVADSSNHRVQVFDQNGTYLKDFGRYGNSEGEFDCLAGVAVNQNGEYIIADRYNHRIQVFDSSGSFLRCFGCQGTVDGKFSYPWGLATDSEGMIFVCDKENHRIQIFYSDGTFCRKFGSMGNKVDQLEHPHYIAVSDDNKVIVSDSNNHRIQIFNTEGDVLSSFGKEGSDEGQFKFPRGLAVDGDGKIYVADSGNNRIQVFNSDGAIVKSFGCWGSADSEFKGLEGVAVIPDGRILVCDRENHRVQMFQAV